MVAQSALSNSISCFSMLDSRRCRKSIPAPAITSVNTMVYAAVRRNRSDRVIFFRAGAVWRTSHLPGAGLFDRLLHRLVGRLDHIADAANGLNQLQRKTVVDLAAEVPDVDVDDVR